MRASERTNERTMRDPEKIKESYHRDKGSKRRNQETAPQEGTTSCLMVSDGATAAAAATAASFSSSLPDCPKGYTYSTFLSLQRERSRLHASRAEAPFFLFSLCVVLCCLCIY